MVFKKTKTLRFQVILRGRVYQSTAFLYFSDLKFTVYPKAQYNIFGTAQNDHKIRPKLKVREGGFKKKNSGIFH